MASVSEAMQDALVQSLAGLVPEDRIRVRSEWRGLRPPYVVHWTVSSDAGDAAYGEQAIGAEHTHQVDIFAASYMEAERLRNAVIAGVPLRLDADWRCWLGGGPAFVEVEDGIHHAVVTYTLVQGG